MCLASVFDLDEGLVDLLLSLQVSVDPWLEDHGTKFRAQPVISVRPQCYSHGSLCDKDQSIFLTSMKAYPEAAFSPV